MTTYTLSDGTPLVPAGRTPRKCDYCPTVYTPRAIHSATCGAPECLKRRRADSNRRQQERLKRVRAEAAAAGRTPPPVKSHHRQSPPDLEPRTCPYCSVVYTPPSLRSQTCGERECVYAHTLKLNRDRQRQRRAERGAEAAPTRRNHPPTTRRPARETPLDLTGRTQPSDPATSPWPHPKAPLSARLPSAGLGPRAARRAVDRLLGPSPARRSAPIPAAAWDERDEPAARALVPLTRAEVFPSAEAPFPEAVLSALRRAVALPSVRHAGLIYALAQGRADSFEVVTRLAVTDGMRVDAVELDHPLCYARWDGTGWLVRNQYGEARL